MNIYKFNDRMYHIYDNDLSQDWTTKCGVQSKNGGMLLSGFFSLRYRGATVEFCQACIDAISDLDIINITEL